MFQFPRFPPPGLCVRPGGARAPPGGFSHSETPGSRAVCASPGTIAACRVLRRLHVPRHPPCALDIFPPRGRAAGRVPTSSNLLPQAGPRPGRRGPGRSHSSVQTTHVVLFLLQYIDGFRCTPSRGCRSNRFRLLSRATVVSVAPRRYAALQVRGVGPRGPDTRAGGGARGGGRGHTCAAT